MNTRSIRSTVHFSAPFTLPGCPSDLPAGDYDLIVEEELLHGLSFAAYRRTATYLSVRGTGARVGRTELCAISDADLTAALQRDTTAPDTILNCEAAHSPSKELK